MKKFSANKGIRWKEYHIPAISKEAGVGSKIVDFVIYYLKKEKIEILAHDFGGNKTRKVYFHTDTGLAYVKQIALKT